MGKAKRAHQPLWARFALPTLCGLCAEGGGATNPVFAGGVLELEEVQA
jgi:hypothetical protein